MKDTPYRLWARAAQTHSDRDAVGMHYRNLMREKGMLIHKDGGPSQTREPCGCEWEVSA